MNDRHRKIERLNEKRLSFEEKIERGKFIKFTTQRAPKGGYYIKVYRDKRKLNRWVRNFMKELKKRYSRNNGYQVK